MTEVTAHGEIEDYEEDQTKQSSSPPNLEADEVSIGEESLTSESTTEELENPEKVSQERSAGFATSHHVGLSATLSILLVVGGILFLLASFSEILSSSNPDFLTRLLTSNGERILLGVIGVFFLVSPLFLNRFVFKAVNYERDLRIKAQKSTREAQLLQDILTHDVRNYNQVSKLSAELLAEDFKDNPDAKSLIEKLLESIDGSTLLVERAKMLGKVISDYRLDRRAINALSSIKRSMELILGAQDGKKGNVAIKLPSMPLAPLARLDAEKEPVNVLADDLLDEVFANLFSNSIKYSASDEVFIGIELKHEYDKQLKRFCWKISISDTGKGIPDTLKRSLFSRYLEGAKGSGLGMSIVHALVVGRYGGRIQVKNRVQGDHSKGTLIELFLPAADS
jgi:signal transduction histidine kinase